MKRNDKLSYLEQEIFRMNINCSYYTLHFFEIGGKKFLGLRVHFSWDFES